MVQLRALEKWLSKTEISMWEQIIGKKLMTQEKIQLLNEAWSWLFEKISKIGKP